MDNAELLNQLADIHLPEPVSFWPPAPGWWILALLALVAMVLAARKIWLQAQRQRILQHALAELDKAYHSYSSEADTAHAAIDLLNQVNTVLRRVALVHFPGTAVASLSGSEWVDFVKKKGESRLLDSNLEDALSHGRFQPDFDVDIDALMAFSREWVSSIYRSHHESSSVSPGTAAE